MRTLQLIIVFTLGSILSARADYRPLKLYYMILTADKILNAEITKVDKTFFYVVSVDSNTNRKKTFKVKKFVDWACASRFDSYSVGQKVILLLKKESNFYSILSAGGEGEIPIIKDSVSIPFGCLGFPEDWKIGNGVRSDSISKYFCKVGKKRFAGIQVSLNSFIEAISTLKSKFAINKNATETCSSFIERESDQFFPALAKSKKELLYLLCFDFYEDKEKYCH